jgi:putative spermidine/putrescine transport system ATP-binding protein
MVGTTTLFVTHDQEEALALGDRVGVMSAGHLEQIAPPAELYDRPRTRFVAEFVGLTNRVAGVAHGATVDVLGTPVPLLEGSAGPGPVTALVRPESVRLTPEDGVASAMGAHVLAVSFLGSVCRAQVQLANGDLIVAQMAAAETAGLAPGSAVRVGVLPAPIFAVAD